ncbi:MAG: OmpA family protein [Verrucomicrobiales bacterium]|nr:OmpA family protein [Verrucomicrobiales bacterium]
MKNTIASLTALALLAAPASGKADDVEKFINKLSGKASKFSKKVDKKFGGHDDHRHNDDRLADYNRDRGREPVREVSRDRVSSNPGTQTRSLRMSSAAVPTSLKSSSHVNVRSDRSGRAQVSYEVDPSSKVSRGDILFVKGSTRFADRYSHEIVLDLAEAMTHPSLRHMDFVIEGHASAEGSFEGNMRLSQRRAETIVRELVHHGVSPRRLVAVGYGETEARHSAYSPEYLLAEDRKVVVFRLD